MTQCSFYTGSNTMVGPGLIIPQAGAISLPGRQLTAKAAAKITGDFILLHLFRLQMGEFRSNYDPLEEKIIKNEVAYDGNCRPPATIKNVLLLGSNHIMFGNPHQSRIANTRDLMNTIISPTHGAENWKLIKPTNADIVAFAASLHAKKVLDRNGIPATIFYSPSDLPPGDVPNVKTIREEYKEKKAIHPTMQKVLEEYCFDGLPVYSKLELPDDLSAQRGGDNGKTYKDKLGRVLSGGGILHIMESEFREKARKLLKSLAEDGISGTFGSKKSEKWKIENDQDTYYVRIAKAGRQFSIPIGKGTKAMCAMLVCAMMIKADEMGFSHILNFTHSTETPMVNAGFFLARRLYGTPIYTYSVSIDPEILLPEYSGRNGMPAFRYALVNPMSDTLD